MGNRAISASILLWAALACAAHAACDRHLSVGRTPQINAGSGSWTDFLVTDNDPACVNGAQVEFVIRESSSAAQLWMDESTPSATPRRLVVRADAQGVGRVYFVAKDGLAFTIQATLVDQPLVGEIVTPIMGALPAVSTAVESRPSAARPDSDFAEPLSVRFTAFTYAPVGNVPVTFRTPQTGPTAFFPNGQRSITVTANPFGLASTILRAGPERGGVAVAIDAAGSAASQVMLGIGDNTQIEFVQMPRPPGVVADTAAFRVTFPGVPCGVPTGASGKLRLYVDGVAVEKASTFGSCSTWAGTAFVTWLARLSLGTHTVAAEYSGDPKFAASRADTTFSVSPDWESTTPRGSVALKVFASVPNYRVCPLQAARLLAPTDASLPLAPPSISSYPDGVVEYTLSGCWSGSYDWPVNDAARLLLRFDRPVDRDAVVWQYSYVTNGPQWHALEATIEGNEVMIEFDRVGGDDRSRSGPGSGDVVHGYLAVGTRPPQWPPNVQDLWWAGPTENGWGMMLSQHEDRLFAGLFAYDEFGTPRWYVMPEGSWDAARQTFSGNLYQPTGPSWRAYKPGVFQVGSAVGSASIRFADRDHAVLSFDIGGVHGTKAIGRQLFGTQGLIQPPGAGLWYAYYDEPGWGLFVAQQGTKRFAVWFTYDDAGKTTWMVASDLSPIDIAGTGATNWSGPLYATRSSAWLGGAYDPSRFSVTELGTFGFGVSSSGLSGGLRLTQGPQTIVDKPLRRQPF